MVDPTSLPHLPRSALIDAYGNGGFRFAGMSHRGSLLCLPEGIWAWPVSKPEAIDETVLAPVFAAAAQLDMMIIGTGRDIWVAPVALRRRFRDLRLALETMQTGPAVRTYNVLLGENRRFAAGLIAVD